MTNPTEYIEKNDYLNLKKYLREGGDAKEENEQGETLLLQAIRKKCDEGVIDLLLEYGASLDDFDNEGVSVFDFAIMYNNPRLVDMLLERGVDVNATRRRSRFTPLMGAVCYGRAEMVRKLLDAGADAAVRDAHGLSAYDYARKTNKPRLMELLKS